MKLKVFILSSQQNVVNDYAKRYPFFDLVYIQGIDGMQTAKSSGTLGDRSNRWWFIQIMKDKKPFVSKSYYSITGNAAVASVFFPIYDSTSNMIGIAGTDLKLNTLQQTVEKYSKGSDSYSYIVDSEGVVVAHKDKERVSQLYNLKEGKKTIMVLDANGNPVKDSNGNQVTKDEAIKCTKEEKDIINKVLSGKSGTDLIVDSSNSNVIVAYNPIEISGDSKFWGVITVQKKSDAMAFVYNFLKTNVSIVLLFLIISSFTVVYMVKSLTKSLTNLTENSKKMSMGDLTVRTEVSGKDEISDLANTYNIMSENLRNLIMKINFAANIVTTKSYEMNNVADAMGTASRQILATVEELAKGATEQSESVQNGTFMVNEMMSSIDEIYVNSENSAKMVEKVNESVDNGFEVVLNQTNLMKDNKKTTSNVGETIELLAEKSQMVGQIVEVIGNIANQTNMLALNAAIEAARAGEQGRGFAVVADEVRKLAEQTTASSGEISTLLKDIQDRISQSVEEMKLAKEVVSKQENAVNETKLYFDEIKQSVGNIVIKINEVALSANKVNNNAKKVSVVIETIADVAQENSAAAQEVVATTQEQTDVVLKISTSSGELVNEATNLLNEIKEFKI